jgi:cephalosporin hydroxylase
MTEWVSNNATVVVAILVHGAASVWFASKMNTTVTMGFKNLNESVLRIDKELEKRDREAKEVNGAMWKRIDEVRDRVTHLEAQR